MNGDNVIPHDPASCAFCRAGVPIYKPKEHHAPAKPKDKA